MINTGENIIFKCFIESDGWSIATAIGTLSTSIVALIAIFGDKVRLYFIRPKFDIIEKLHENKDDNESNGGQTTSADLRLIFKNTGNSRANNCKFIVSSFQNETPNEEARDDTCELSLKQSLNRNGRENSTLDIESSDTAIIKIGSILQQSQTKDQGGNNIILLLNFKDKNSKEIILKRGTKYRLGVQFQGDNFSLLRKEISLIWKGNGLAQCKTGLTFKFI